MEKAVIVAMGRSATGQARKGTLKHTRPEEIGAQVLKGVLDKVPKFDKNLVEDVIVGCAFPEGEQGMNMAKIIATKAGLPQSVPGQTINRFCSSGLQSVATAANAIMAGQAKVIIAGGVESMSTIPLGGNLIAPDPVLMDEHPKELTTMGITAENVAKKYNISREEQDLFAVSSHKKAYEAQMKGYFEDQIIPVKAKEFNKKEKKLIEIEFKNDEGIRPNTSLEILSKLRTPFKMGGTVTAGNSSQTTDGAAFVVVMAESLAKELELEPIAYYKSFASVGIDPEYMGLGPIYAIPKAIELANISLAEVDLVELNEAFASQAIASIRELKLDEDKVNVNGGAIATGHPLGCTGTILIVKLLSELKRQNKKQGVVSMCIGGGMGAAGVFELS